MAAHISDDCRVWLLTQGWTLLECIITTITTQLQNKQCLFFYLIRNAARTPEQYLQVGLLAALDELVERRCSKVGVDVGGV